MSIFSNCSDWGSRSYSVQETRYLRVPVWGWGPRKVLERGWSSVCAGMLKKMVPVPAKEYLGHSQRVEMD